MTADLDTELDRVCKEVFEAVSVTLKAYVQQQRSGMARRLQIDERQAGIAVGSAVVMGLLKGAGLEMAKVMRLRGCSKKRITRSLHRFAEELVTVVQDEMFEK